MVIRAVEGCARQREIGLLLVGDGPRRARLQLMASRCGYAAIVPRLEDRHELARLLASADALVHGCEAETFCLVAAEARASGLPMIVPDRGAALDLLAPHAGTTYRAGREASLERAILRFVDSGVELQRAAAARASNVRTMDQHFAELFGRYAELTAAPRHTVLALEPCEVTATTEFALARSAVTRG
jgi:alpha-1,6-mannosyltransferase